MIDIHAHVLPFVDDGSDSVCHSVELIRNEIEAGVTDVIYTPHHRRGFCADAGEIESAKKALDEKLSEKGIKINLYPGREIHICSGKNYKELASRPENRLCGGKFVLIEFDFKSEFDITDAVYELKIAGYIPVVAHYERYAYSSLSKAQEIKNVGGMIQVNANSLVGKASFKAKILGRKLVKTKLCDFVASDCHYGRDNKLKEAYAYVEKKCGKGYAELVFSENAEKILKELD